MIHKANHAEKTTNQYMTECGLEKSGRIMTSKWHIVDCPDCQSALFDKAVTVIRADRRASVSHLQRKLRLNYRTASIIMEQLESRGIVGPQVGSTPRQIM